MPASATFLLHFSSPWLSTEGGFFYFHFFCFTSFSFYMLLSFSWLWLFKSSVWIGNSGSMEWLLVFHPKPMMKDILFQLAWWIGGPQGVSRRFSHRCLAHIRQHQGIHSGERITFWSEIYILYFRQKSSTKENTFWRDNLILDFYRQRRDLKSQI